MAPSTDDLTFKYWTSPDWQQQPLQFGEKKFSSWMELISASFRQSTVLGAAISNRMINAIEAENYEKESFDSPFNAHETVDQEYIQTNPHVAYGVPYLLESTSHDDLAKRNEHLRQRAADMDVIREHGLMKSLFASLLVNMIDPINLIPASKIFSIAKGVGAVQLARNTANAALVGGLTNVAQDRIIRSLGPDTGENELLMDAAAMGIGAMFGGAVGFLASPNWGGPARMGRTSLNETQPHSMGADTPSFEPASSRIAIIRKRLFQGLNEERDIGNKVDSARNEVKGESPADSARAGSEDASPGSVVDMFASVMETSERNLRRTLDGIKNKIPDIWDRTSDLHIWHLHREGPIPDESKTLVEQIKVAVASVEGDHKVIVGEHPLQQEFNLLSKSEQAVSDTLAALNIADRPAKGMGQATTVQTSPDKTSRAISEGISLIAKTTSYLTPLGAVNRSILDLPKLALRVMVYDGSVTSKAFANFMRHRGSTPASSLKEMYQAWSADLINSVQEAYFAEFAAKILKKPGEMVKRIRSDDMTYTDSTGHVIAIKASNNYKEFQNAVVDIIRSRHMKEIGFGDEFPSNIDPRLEAAVSAVRKMYGKYLDELDFLGILPGQRALKSKLERHKQMEGKIDELETEAVNKIEERLAKAEERLNTRKGKAKEQIDKLLSGIEGKERADLAEHFATSENVPALFEGRVGAKGLGTNLRAIRKLEETTIPGIYNRMSSLDNRIGKLKEKLDKLSGLIERNKRFLWDSNFYLPVRYLSDAVREQKEEFVQWIIRSLRKEQKVRRNFDSRVYESSEPGMGRETTVKLSDDEVPLDNRVLEFKVRKKSGVETVKLNKEDQASLDELMAEKRAKHASGAADTTRLLEGDLDAVPGLRDKYMRLLNMYQRFTAIQVRNRLLRLENAHGTKDAMTNDRVTKPGYLLKRHLPLDHTDPAAKIFTDSNIERIIKSYDATVGGHMAQINALNKAKAAGLIPSNINNFDDLIEWVDKGYTRVTNSTTQVDKLTGSKITDEMRKDRDRVMKRLLVIRDRILGHSSWDPNGSRHAVMGWFGGHLLNMNYMALLGAQVLPALNDFAAIIMHAEWTNLPRYRKMISAIIKDNLSEMTRKEMELFKLGWEGVHSRIRSFGAAEMDTSGAGVGHGLVRNITSKVDTVVDRMSRIFNEATLINPYNRFVKSGAAMLAMDRFVDTARKKVLVSRLVDSGVQLEDAMSQVGLKQLDAARLADHGINIDKSHDFLELVHRYGTDLEGKPLNEIHENFDDFLENYDSGVIPQGWRWVAEEGDSVRPLLDAYMAGINAEVEHGMVITPGIADLPMINDSWFGRAVNQFHSFSFAWANQVAAPLAQHPSANQVGTISAYFFFGAMVDAIKNEIAGRRSLAETAELWITNPLGMTYSVVHTSGVSGVLDRPMAFADKLGIGPGAFTGNVDVSRASFQARSFWGSLSPVADFADRTLYGILGPISAKSIPTVSQMHQLRKSIPFQNWIGFKLLHRYTGFDPLMTNKWIRDIRGEPEPRP